MVHSGDGAPLVVEPMKVVLVSALLGEILRLLVSDELKAPKANGLR
jgi:hypothetical protein